jgi:hypothetical protein
MGRLPVRPTSLPHLTVAVLRRLLRAAWSATPGWIALAISLAPAGCRPKPACDPDDAKGCVITKLRIDQRRSPGGGGVSEDDVKARLATAESSFFVTHGTVELLQGTGELFFRYERFDQLVLERDLERIVRYYQARGYYEATVRAARVLREGDSTVRVLLEVDEGPPTLVKKADIEFTNPLPKGPPDLPLAIARAKGAVKVGARFEEEAYDAAKRRIVRALTDRGYAYAAVTGRAHVDRARREATATFVVDVGPPCTFGPISIEGHGDLPEEKLRAVLDIEPGEPFSTDALDRAQQALGETGVLGSVTVDVVRKPEDAPDRSAVPVRFLVQQAALRSIVVGGGAELGSSVRAHVVTSWEHKNFLGGMRRLFLDARTGARFYPLQLVNWDVPDPGVRVLPEVRTTADLRHPGLFEKRTTGSARLEGKFFRPDTADPPGIPNVLLYSNVELHATAGLERPFWKSRVRLGGSINAQLVAPVPMYTQPGQPALPEGFDWIYMPYFEASTVLDLRRGKDNKPDTIYPRSGFYAAANLQAALIFPEGAWDIRVRPELRAFAPIAGDVTLAFRVGGGLLFPFGYGRRLFDTGASCAPGDFACTGNPCNGDAACEADRSRSLQITQLRGFYSGGLDSNRGYGRNGVNPQEEVLALLQAGTGGGLTRRSPIGGRWLWEAQIELRFPIYGSFGGSVFVDAGDAWYAELAFRPHLSAGFGLRYATPIGPLRADLGFRIPCAQEIGTCEPRPVELGGPPDLLGVPLNVSIALGNPF